MAAIVGKRRDYANRDPLEVVRGGGGRERGKRERERRRQRPRIDLMRDAGEQRGEGPPPSSTTAVLGIVTTEMQSRCCVLVGGLAVLGRDRSGPRRSRVDLARRNIWRWEKCAEWTGGCFQQVGEIFETRWSNCWD